MSETILVNYPIGVSKTRSPAVAVALISISATAEVLQSLSKTLPTGGLALIISEVLAILGALVASVLVSRVSKRIESK
jgi:hypothetical protein